MKIIGTLVAVVMVLAAAAQQTIPNAVKESFSKIFPGVIAKWKKEKNDYEAVFIKDAKDMSANFSVAGEWQETETAITSGELPQPSREYIANQYPKAIIEEAAKIEKRGAVIIYEAEVGKVDILFDAGGKFMTVEKK